MGSVPILPLVLIGLLAAGAVLYVRGSRRLAPILAALVAGPACYAAVGLAVPRITGEGRFFSTPFGGLAVGDRELLLSLLAWTLLWWVLLHYAKRKN